MKKLVEMMGRPLAWSQPSAFQMHYSLAAGDATAATLEFRSMLGSFATGKSGDGCWTFKRMGFFQTRVTIRECDGEKEVGQFRNSIWSGGGGLEVGEGRRYLATTSVWQTKLEFQTESGSPLFHLKGRGLLHQAADLTILPEAMRIPEFPWMMLLGFYLMVMMQQDAAAGA